VRVNGEMAQDETAVNETGYVGKRRWSGQEQDTDPRAGGYVGRRRKTKIDDPPIAVDYVTSAGREAGRTFVLSYYEPSHDERASKANRTFEKLEKTLKGMDIALTRDQSSSDRSTYDPTYVYRIIPRTQVEFEQIAPIVDELESDIAALRVAYLRDAEPTYGSSLGDLLIPTKSRDGWASAVYENGLIIVPLVNEKGEEFRSLGNAIAAGAKPYLEGLPRAYQVILGAKQPEFATLDGSRLDAYYPKMYAALEAQPQPDIDKLKALETLTDTPKLRLLVDMEVEDALHLDDRGVALLLRTADEFNQGLLDLDGPDLPREIRDHVRQIRSDLKLFRTDGPDMTDFELEM
jgi:hypothetical protein